MRLPRSVAALCGMIGAACGPADSSREPARAAPMTSVEASTPVRILSTTALVDALQARRGRIVVVNFWATWCVPCVTELPALEQAYRAWVGRGVEFLGVSCDLLVGGRPEAQGRMVREFLAERGISFPNVLFTGLEDDLVSEFDHPGALPFTLILDRDGRPVHRFDGPFPEGALDRALAAVLPPGD